MADTHSVADELRLLNGTRTAAEALARRRAERGPPTTPERAAPRRIVIVGAAGRDFHNFNIVYRDDPDIEVVAFTATQIPGIADRRYPAALASTLYPEWHLPRPARRRGRVRL